MEKTKLSIEDYNGRGEALIYDEKDNLVAIVPDVDWANYIVETINFGCINKCNVIEQN